LRDRSERATQLEEIAMKKVFLVCVLPLFISANPALAVMSQTDCQAMWKKADANGNGSLDAKEAKIYTAAMTKAKIKPKDATKLDSAEFMKACQAGAFDSLKT
jgi:hypothetical protein